MIFIKSQAYNQLRTNFQAGWCDYCTKYGNRVTYLDRKGDENAASNISDFNLQETIADDETRSPITESENHFWLLR